MKKHRITEILVMPTMRCDRGCIMCSSGSVREDEDMSDEMMDRLVDQIIKIKGAKFVYIFGGGEPLLYNTLPRYVSRLLDDKYCVVELVTSGCRDENDSGFEVLQRISQDTRLRVVLSYHGFNGSKAAERVRFSLPLLAETAGVCINFVADFDDMEKIKAPVALLEEMLQDMGYPVVHGELVDGLTKKGQLWVAKSDHRVEIRSFPLKPEVGRARKLSDSEIKWCWMKGCEAFEGHRIIMLDASGNMWPCQTVLRSPELSIGNFGDISLKKALRASKGVIRSRRKRHFNSQTSCQCPCFHCLP